MKVSLTADGIKVSWDKCAGAGAYRVFYKTSASGSWKKIGDTTKTSYTRKNAKLTSGKTYWFTVRCVKAKDSKTYVSSYDDAGAKVLFVKAPAVKASLTANGIRISWDKCAGAVAYRVFYKTSANGSWKKIGDTTKTSYTRKNAKLTSGKTYWFTVRCVNAKGKYISAYKASNSLKYTDGTLPTDGDRDVFEGTLNQYTYDQVKAMLGAMDSRPSYAVTYWIIVLDKPQKLKVMEAAGPLVPVSVEVSMIYVRDPSSLTAYAGKHAIFSMDPYKTSMPSDTSSPLGIPRTLDVRVLG